MFKNKFLVSLMIITIVIIFGAGVSGAKDFIGISTASSGGTFYACGVSLSTILTEELKDQGLNFSAHTSGGSSENLQMIKNEEINMAIAGGVPTYYAYEGIEAFEGNQVPNVRFVSALWPEAISILYREGTDIENLEDLEGKKVAVGPPGGGGSFYMPGILKEGAGLTFEDFDEEYLGYSETVQAMQNRQIDACYLGGGIPNAPISQLYASQIDVGMIEFTEEQIENIKDEYPFYTKITISEGTYSGQDEPLTVIGMKSAFIADKSLDDDIVYKILEVIYLKRLDDLKERQASLKLISLEEATKGLTGAPFHPGAVKFYRDNGLSIPDDLLPPEMK